jgi:hypothetical protein
LNLNLSTLKKCLDNGAQISGTGRGSEKGNENN